jgi:alkylation response protein AidB-like acyl-CoA dehydrogenase
MVELHSILLCLSTFWSTLGFRKELPMSVEHVLVESARTLAKELAPRSAEIETARQIPADLCARMAQAGFFRMFLVERLGGLEVSPAIAAQVYEALAEGDAACGWIAFIAASTGLALSRMNDQAVGEIFATPETMLAGVFAPSGRATKVDGGFQVQGRWQWGSGSLNAHWIGAGCVLVQDGEPLTKAAGVPRNHMLFFRASQLHSLDTWHVSGLCGTGSTDFEVRDAFVLDRHAAGYLVRKPPDRPLFRFPAFAPLAHGVAAVAMGVARASIGELLRLASEKKRAGVSLSSRSHVQIEVAKSEARLRSARAFFYETIEAAWQAAQSGEPVALTFSRDLRLATTHALQEAVAVVDAMYSLAGGTSVYQASPLQRHFRDVHVAAQHMMVSTGTLETVGRLFLGLETDTSGF